MKSEERAIISKWSQKINERIKAVLPNLPSEADFRLAIDQMLGEFCDEAGLYPLAHVEYTLATGRADAIFNRLIIEYKKPGYLKKRPDNKTLKAIDQLKGYINELSRKEKYKLDRLAGVVLDGKFIIFVRNIRGNWIIEDPLEVNQNSLERFLNWLSSLSSGIALTSENLNKDFSIAQIRTQSILRSLYQGLSTCLDEGDGLVPKLFEQWRLFFSEAIDYSEAFGGRKLEPLKQWVRKAGLYIERPYEAERFFFALHTYFALLVKLLAWLALSRHLGAKLFAPEFGKLASCDGQYLRDKLKEMESGGIFRHYGLLNLLEGDFFCWYLYAWNDKIEESLRELIKRLDDYDPTTLSIVPEETRDLFKKLYHYLLPREIRHNLGEYYTPDWLAQHVLNQVDEDFFSDNPLKAEKKFKMKILNTRFLDPACGSGTFLVLIISRFLEIGKQLFIPEEQLLECILKNVVGFDLNPLAVLTSRVNYLLAIAELLPFRKKEITVPVYLADSVRTPALGEELFTQNAYEFNTSVGRFLIPAVLCTKERFNQFCDLIEMSLDQNWDLDTLINRLRWELNIPDNQWDERTVSLIKDLYERMIDYHRRGWNGLWARLLKNNFAPIIAGEFDYIIGNPPWINWEHLPDEYRQSIKPLWEKYGLFPHGGMDTILGKGKKDISMLMTFIVIDKLLKNKGKLGFVITQSLFKTSGAAQGFRRLTIPQSHSKYVDLKMIKVEDMTKINPFEGAANRTAIMIIEKGKPTEFPVPYIVWQRKENSRFNFESSLKEVKDATRRLSYIAEPVDLSDRTSPWLTARPKALKAIRKILGKSDYEAHEGVNTGGANGVFWLEEVYRRPDGLIVVRNITEGAKTQVEEVTETIEPDLLYPLLRGRDVQRWKAEPSALILIVQDPIKRRGIDEEDLKNKYPRTYSYLKKFESVLRERAAFKRYFTRKDKNGKVMETGPFYSMFDIGDYTFAPWKVVWRYIATDFIASCVGSSGTKPVIPNEKLMLINCNSKIEAYYLSGIFNSSILRFAVKSFFVETQIAPKIISYLNLPKYNPKNLTHSEIAKLSEKAHELSKVKNIKSVSQIEQEIDKLAAKIWGLSEQELKEIQRNLSELEGEDIMEEEKD